MTHDYGGPAFPYGREWNGDRSAISRWEENGQTLLDYLAGLAMHAIVTREGPREAIENGDSIANVAYSVAADMIAEKRRREDAAKGK